MKNQEATDNLSTYLKEINRYALLSHAEEIDYAQRIKKGEKEAFHAFVNANLRLVVKVAYRYTLTDFGFMDLIQEGNLGLIKAVEKYDDQHKVRFSTYAVWWIKNSINRALENKRRTIRLPQRKEKILRDFQKFSDEFIQNFARRPSVDDFIEEKGFKREEVFSILELLNSTISLDSPIDETGGNLYDILEDNAYNPESEFERKDLCEETQRFLNVLREKEKTALIHRYAFGTKKKGTFKNIAEKMGVSPETVRQLEIAAIKKLRRQALPMREYLYK